MQTILVGNVRPIPLVSAGDGPTLLANKDTANSVFLGDDAGLTVASSNLNIELTAGSFLTVDGRKDVWAISAVNAGVNIDVISGGVSFFQLSVLTAIILSNIGQGIFIYNGTPMLGNLIGSWAPMAGTDKFGNIFPAGMKIYNGQLAIQDPAFVTFPSGASFEQGIATIASTVGGTNPAQFIQLAIESASTTGVGAHDSVLAEFNSAAQDNSSNANLTFIYVGSNGNLHEYAYMDSTGFNLIPGTIVAPLPGTIPATPESWHILTLQNSFTAGVNNGFTDAPSYAILPFGPYYSPGIGKTVAFRGTLVTPGSGGVTGLTFGAVPAGYRPQAGPFSRVNGLVNAGGGQSGRIDLHSDGNLQLGGGFGNGAIIDITGLTYI